MNNMILVAAVMLMAVVGVVLLIPAQVPDPSGNGNQDTGSQDPGTGDPGSDPMDGGSGGSQDPDSLWRTAELTDVRTGETFTVSDFEGKPVILESFAVWCPICLQQQREIQRAIDLEGDTIVHVSLDTDPNEDVSNVKNHLDRHGFEWFFSVAPEPVTQDLIDEFGLSVVNAPSAPVIIIDENGNARLLRSGIKTAEELIDEAGV